MTDSFARLDGWTVPVGTLYTVTEPAASGRFETRRYLVVAADRDGAAVMHPDPDNEEDSGG